MELSTIVRAAAESYTHDRRVSGQQRRALTAIAQCRTEALGATVSQCDRCGEVQVRYHSCRNRHCPKCQTLAKERWLAARTAQLLPVPYFHVVFTLPHALNQLAQRHPRSLYALLFESAASTLQSFADNPKWLGAELGITMVLHTWSQTLEQHLHVHCLITAGGLTAAGQWRRSKPSFLFPVRALSRVFRGKFLAALHRAYARGDCRLPGQPGALPEAAAFQNLFRSLRAQQWVVYAKRPFAGAEHLLGYLARYTHRIAISNERLLSYDNDSVRFRYRDRRRGDRPRTMTLPRDEFLRRFLLHVLPLSFMRIRHFGLFANRTRARKLALAQIALQQSQPEPPRIESAADFMLRVTGFDILRCPHCGEGRLQIISVTATPRRALIHCTGPPP